MKAPKAVTVRHQDSNPRLLGWSRRVWRWLLGRTGGGAGEAGDAGACMYLGGPHDRKNLARSFAEAKAVHRDRIVGELERLDRVEQAVMPRGPDALANLQSAREHYLIALASLECVGIAIIPTRPFPQDSGEGENDARGAR